jgi:hypothetical protein
MPSLAADPENGENVLPEPAETLGAERQEDPALQGDRLVEPPRHTSAEAARRKACGAGSACR